MLVHQRVLTIYVRKILSLHATQLGTWIFHRYQKGSSTLVMCDSSKTAQGHKQDMFHSDVWFMEDWFAWHTHTHRSPNAWSWKRSIHLIISNLRNKLHLNLRKHKKFIQTHHLTYVVSLHRGSHVSQPAIILAPTSITLASLLFK